MASEPYSSYQHVKRDIPLPINENGQCVVAKDLHTDNDMRKKWVLSSMTILAMRGHFTTY